MGYEKIRLFGDKPYISNRPNKIVVHNLGENPHPLNGVGVEYLRYLHKVQNQWSDVGYHWVISEDFGIESGRTWWTQASATLGHNRTSLNICLCQFSHWGYDPEGWIMYCPDLMKLLEIQIRRLMMTFSIPKENIFGHRDLQPLKKDKLGASFKNSCPGFDVQTWIKTIF